MKRITLFSSVFLLSLIISSCDHQEVVALDVELTQLIGNKDQYILPASNDFASIPQSPVNPLTPEKIELGKMLFFEPKFANEAMRGNHMFTFTCSSCHIVESGFRPGRMQGIADGGFGMGIKGESRTKAPYYMDHEIDAQGARPLATINVAFVENTMWNGSFGSEGHNVGTEDMWGVFDPGTARNHARLGTLEGQNIEGLIVHRMMYTKEIIEEAGYKEMFDRAFPDLSEADKYSRTGASFAISAYLRALITNEAPFQLWLRGQNSAMTEQQKRGAIVFFGKAACNTCHFEKNLGSMRFEALGVRDLYERGGLKTNENDLRNFGRGGFTGRAEDMFKFRTPQLYNMGDSGPYFHGGSKETLEEVVEYFNQGIPENPRVPRHQLTTYLRPLGLSDQEKSDLVEFLRNGLRDPNLERYAPKEVISGMCFPNNDVLSRNDMGCR